MSTNELSEMFERALKDTGVSVQMSAAAVAAFAASRAAHLSNSIGEPGFENAVSAEADNVALFAGLEAVEQGDLADARALGVFVGLLEFGALLLARA